uniref:Reverse transcriptase domain-containing protein n=1 Tax=Tanacetum cinerariifolium TaxID=118510 RepID=A0A699GHV7_TANCI|nr:reverse transcriptase domain-containing protein [Tanacetum cinerariifolium]
MRGGLLMAKINSLKSNQGWRVKIRDGRSVKRLEVQKYGQFHGLPGDDANRHIDKFLEITQHMKQNGVSDDALPLSLFPYSLRHHGITWYDHLPRNSIHSFDDMMRKFLSKYFPPSMVTKLRNEITKFGQKPYESLFEARERYKFSIVRCPNHNMLLVTQIDTLYNGLTLSHWDTINAAAGGTFNNTVPNPREDLKAITTRSGVTLAGPSVSPLLLPSKELDREPEMTTDQVLTGSTNNVPPLVVQPSPASTFLLLFHFLICPRILHFELSFTNALFHMPKFALMFKSLLNNKEKLFDLAMASVNKNCSVVILKKLSKKLGDPGKFIIPCDFPEFDECLALEDLGASINLMPLSIWKKLSFLELTSTQMILELADRSTTRPVACEEYVQEVLGFSDKSKSGSPTPTSDLIISFASPSFTPFEGSDFILEEIKTFLRTPDEFSNLDDDYYDTERDILYLEKLLNEDPSLNISLVKTEDLKQVDATMTKPSIDEPPELELKELPSHLEYVFLEWTDKLTVIISKELKDEEKIHPFEEDQEKTTFTCPYGTFAYRCMPFGLRNAPGTFQRNLFPPLVNPELTIRRRSSYDPTLLNNSKMAAERPGDLPVPDLQTMEELCQPSLNGETFIKRHPEECYDLIENMTGHHNDWDTSAQRSDSSSSITSSSFNTEIAALKAEMMKINKNLMRVHQVNQQVKAVTPNCETCGGPHSFSNCPATVGNTQNVYAAGAYQDSSASSCHHQYKFINFIKANDAILKNMQTNMTSLRNSNLELKNMFDQFMKMNTASSLGSGTLLVNTITNLKEDLKGIVTKRGTAYPGPTIPTTSFSPVVERETEATEDTVNPTNNGNTEDVQPPVVQSESLILNSESVNSPTVEPVASPVSAPRPNQRPPVPYPSRLRDQKLHNKANDQCERYFQIFKDLNFNISFADALILMPKFGPSIKSLLTNKDKICELARTPLNEHCSAVLLRKLSEKLGDPGKFLIPCDFSEMAECLALADLKASINLMPLFVWNKLSLHDLSPTCTFHFPADFVVVDFDADPRVPLILGRSFLKTGRALIDVFEALADDSNLPKVDQSYLDSEGDILLLEDFLNDDPSLPPLNQGDYLPEVRKELKICKAKSDKSSIDEPLEVELKDLPPHLEYVFLEGDDKFPVIIVKDLSVEEKTALITVLKSHKQAIAWKLSDIKVVENEENELIPNRLVSGWRVCIDYHQEKPHSPTHMERLLTVACLLGYAMHQARFRAPIWIALDWDMPFELMCDASDFAIGADNTLRQKDHNWGRIQLQHNGKGNTGRGVCRQNFRSYLIMNKIIVYTDHFALKYLFAKKDSKARFLRWVLLLQEFTFKVIDTKGAKNLVADHLSRLENPHQNVLDPKEINESFLLETLNLVSTRGVSSFSMLMIKDLDL